MTTLDHIIVKVNDLQASVDFYTSMILTSIFSKSGHMKSS